MSAFSRLHTAIQDGVLSMPEGAAVCLMRPPAGFDVTALGDRPIAVMHSFAPDHAIWSNAGYDTKVTPTPAPVAIISMSRSKSLSRAMVAEAAKWAKLIMVDGQKTDGVESLFKSCRRQEGNLSSISKAHGRLFWFTPKADYSDWVAPGPTLGPHGFYTAPGVYADGAVDKGSTLLAEALPAQLPQRIADLGAGWGYLSRAILEREGVSHLDLVEAEAIAIDCAKRNLDDPRAHFHWADATRFVAPQPYDMVVMNPPFHVSRKGDPGLGKAFITSAAGLLTPKGALWMVANRHLPYEETLNACFHSVQEVAGNGGFKVFNATRPRR